MVEVSTRAVISALAVRLRHLRAVLEESFVGRWLELLLDMQFVDRSVALAAKGVLALLPALVTVAAVASDDLRANMASTLERRMGLSGESLDLVRDGFTSNGQATISTGVVGALLTVFYATTFTSALRRLYLSAWHCPQAFDRLAHLKGLAWLGGVVLLFGVGEGLRSFRAGFPGWLLFGAIVAAATVGGWWVTAYVMLRGQVRWRLLLPSAVLTSVGSWAYGTAAALWMPRSVIVNEEQYGYFGVFMTIVSWLVGLAFIVVCATALGPILADDGGRLGRLVRGQSDDVWVAGGRAQIIQGG
jgi:membrane protein